MVLSNSFYIEIFAKEKKWIDLINEGLLNSIYCIYELKPFYTDKKEILEKDCSKNSTDIKKEVLLILTNIIDEINLLDSEYRIGRNPNVKDLLSYFLTNQLNDSKTIENNKTK